MDVDYQQLLGAAAEHLATLRPFIPMYIHLVVSALFPIYTGAHASLSRPASAAKPPKKDTKAADAQDEDEEEAVQKMEGLSPKDAVVFPVTAGIVLAGLYFLIKRYGAHLVNLILGYYFSGVGVYSVGKLVNDSVNLLLSFLLPTYFAGKGKLWKVDNTKRKAVAQTKDTENASMRESPVPLLSRLPRAFYDTIWSIRTAVKQRYTTKVYIHDIMDFKGNLTLINLFSAISGVAAVSYANFVAKPWYLTNLQGFAVSYSALQFMSPTTFPTGSLILGGLFFYDIWAVFFTPLMVTVAKNLDQPIKLVFPRPDEPSETPGGKPTPGGFSMLGLGDIVLPGIMIGLALRFDLYMYYLKKQRTVTRKVISAEGAEGEEQAIEKATYVPVTGQYGDRFWTSLLPTSARPERLRTSFPKPYFYASMAGYVLGMLATLGVMSVFNHAQPALLYLVPGVVGSLWATALVKGELKQMWNFSEAVTGEQLDEDERKDPDKDKENEEQKDERSTWQWLKDELFGTSGDIPTKPDNGDKLKDDKATSGSKNTDEKTSRSINDVLFTISIARHHPEGSSEAKPAVDTAEMALNNRSQTSSESSGLEDAVLVDSDDV